MMKHLLKKIFLLKSFESLDAHLFTSQIYIFLKMRLGRKLTFQHMYLRTNKSNKSLRFNICFLVKIG